MEKYSIETFFEINEYSHKELFNKCETVWEALIHLKRFFQGRVGKIECPIPEGVHLVNKKQISIGKGTVVEPGAFIKGPCVIGENCEIRHGAYIRGNVVAGNRCVIGHCTEVKNAIFLDGVSAGHFNYVGDSILGNQVNLGAGVKLANFRLDQGKAVILGIDTGLAKLGAIIGDETQLGCNVVTNPGTLIGKEVFCRANLTVSGYIPTKARIKTNQKTVVQTYASRSCI